MDASDDQPPAALDDVLKLWLPLALRHLPATPGVLDREERGQEAARIVLEAHSKWDPHGGTPWRPHMATHIERLCQDKMRGKRHAHDDDVNGLLKARRQLRRHGTEPTLDDLVAHTGLTLERLIQAQADLARHQGLLRADGADERALDLAASDEPSPEDEALLDDEHVRLSRALIDAGTDDPEYDDVVLALKYFTTWGGYTFEDLARLHLHRGPGHLHDLLDAQERFDAEVRRLMRPGDPADDG